MPDDPHIALAKSPGHILAVNGGSSSIKFALYANAAPPRRLLAGRIERIGAPGGALLIAGEADRPFAVRDHEHAAAELGQWLTDRLGPDAVAAIGHRVVHGGVRLTTHQPVTDSLIAELRRNQPLDPAHLPREIALIEGLGRRFPGRPQVACFDTAFHHDLPPVARLLPIPRKFLDAGVRRLGFHGLSYAYLMEELGRLGEAGGRVILAHLGSGASMAAVRDGHPIDTSMAFTPNAGLVMATRCGDLDPGLLLYLMRQENLTADEMEEFVSRQCGLLGVSATSGDMRDLMGRAEGDSRAADAVDLFCYQGKKWIGSFAAALGGLDTLVFAGGIGENSPEVRARICTGLEFLGIQVDSARNAATAPMISSDQSRVRVRVIQTNEELMIARAVQDVAWAADDSIA